MVTTKITPICCLLLIFFTASLSAQSIGAQVLDAEQARFDAMIAKDTVALERMLSKDLVYVHSNALKENKQDHIRSVASGKIVYQEMTHSENRVRIYRKIAINTGAIKVKGIISGNPFDVKMLYTAVYQKKKGRWQLLSWQTTRIP